MTAISNEDFAKRMLLVARPADQYRPIAMYDRDGDCIEFLAKPHAFYGERIDDLVTVYYSQETGEVVGSLIKGVARFCREFAARNPGFRIVIEDGPVRLEHIFLAKLWSAPHEKGTLETLVYRKLIEVAGEATVQGELCAI